MKQWEYLIVGVHLNNQKRESWLYFPGTPDSIIRKVQGISKIDQLTLDQKYPFRLQINFPSGFGALDALDELGTLGWEPVDSENSWYIGAKEIPYGFFSFSILLKRPIGEIL